MKQFLDRSETWLFNTFRRILVAAALIALVVSGFSLLRGLSNVFDSPDIAATDEIEQVEFSDYEPEEPQTSSATGSTGSRTPESKMSAEQNLDPRIVEISENYTAIGSGVKEEVLANFSESLGEREDEFLDGFVDWSEDVNDFYSGKNDDGELSDEIGNTLDIYIDEFGERVSEKEFAASESSVEAATNNVEGLSQLLFCLYALGAVVAVIVILLAFKIEVDLRAIRDLGGE